MSRILLVRHGETAWNVEKVFRGRIDIPLNERGLKQAELLGEHLSDEDIIAVYSSPLRRALGTAEEVAKHHGLRVEELVDLDYGEWQGLLHGTVREKYKELYEVWLKAPHLVRMLGGESLGDLRKRAIGFVERVVRRYGDREGAVVLVSHRVVNKVLICALLGLDNSHFWKIKIDTCGITTFAYKGGRFVLVGHNDTCFLRPVGTAGTCGAGTK